ncbi:MAG: 2-phospho-L-lactate guanylyltransferase [Anaerolineaceae bacterium]|jgi:2-phospho-L-lactate guanylyltransferase|nr:2-phospho-L-lactate guanylyltransferase [Anaerolineaceae bacterium]OQY91261.1 MAG: 2-phospho-L-lactate guanylyltransferase [Anaerolineae bacterium UTCFX1]
MTIWAIVPVKPLRRGKSRLAGMLSEDERTQLNHALLEHTLNTLSALKEITKVLVISRDPLALNLARQYDARTVQEEGTPHLNAALQRATIAAQAGRALGILILPADLPLITTEDVRALLDRAVKPPVVAIAPDRHKRGTNALVISPAGLIEYAFGEDSFQRHSELAKQAGARLEIVDSFSLALDLDTPEDLEIVKHMENSLLQELLE